MMTQTDFLPVGAFPRLIPGFFTTSGRGMRRLPVARMRIAVTEATCLIADRLCTGLVAYTARIVDGRRGFDSRTLDL